MCVWPYWQRSAGQCLRHFYFHRLQISSLVVDLLSERIADPRHRRCLALTLPRAQFFIAASHLDIARSGTRSRHENAPCLFQFLSLAAFPLFPPRRSGRITLEPFVFSVCRHRQTVANSFSVCSKLELTTQSLPPLLPHPPTPPLCLSVPLSPCNLSGKLRNYPPVSINSIPIRPMRRSSVTCISHTYTHTHTRTLARSLAQTYTNECRRLEGGQKVQTTVGQCLQCTPAGKN